MNGNRQAGVTLLELLIAVTLVGMISLGMLMTIRIGFNAMGKTNDKLYASRKVFSVQRILEQEVQGVMPIAATCISGPKRTFFMGDAQAVRFVSSYSLQEAGRGYPRILELRVIPGDRGQGVRLVVNETLYTGPASAGAFCSSSTPIGAGSFVLADRLAYCRFIYRETVPPPVLDKWQPDWIDKPYLPSALRVEMAPFASDPSRLPLTSLTIPIRVNRDPMVQYVD